MLSVGVNIFCYKLEGISYFVDGTTKVLWERWFHLDDVVKDIPPVIKKFHASEECKTGMPGEGTRIEAPQFEPISRKLDEPTPLNEFIDENLGEIK